MTKALKLDGRVFHRLTVLWRSPNGRDGRTRWRCICVCGKMTIVQGNHLRSGEIKSCGCLARELHGKHETSDE